MITNQVARKLILTQVFVFLFGMVPWGQPNPSVAFPMKSRLIRSCEHYQIGIMAIEACNSGHKRSLALANNILVHHGRPNKSKSDILSGDLNHPSEAHHDPGLLDPLFSPWVLEHASEDSGVQEPSLRWKEDGWTLQEMNYVYKEIYRRAPSTIEMCCTKGCTKADFRRFCYS